MASLSLAGIPSPILLKGNERIAYRDPAAIYADGVFRLFYTLVETEEDGQAFLYTATSESRDLIRWSEPRRLTPRDQALNYSSPGNVVRRDGRWVMCLQTYPRPNGEKYANGTARLYTMESADLVHWTEPELLKVKGVDTPVEEMGRMIDPYLVESIQEPGKWWCFFKQNGVSMSYSYDLKHWSYAGHAEAGENVCVVARGDHYLMLHSPDNGIGVKRSADLVRWDDDGTLLTLGQREWEWARGRITAGFLLDCTSVAGIGKYLLFFHGTGPQGEDVIFDTHACIGIAWSDDLVEWHWPV
ncbi:sialidase family protein [Cohnella sp. GCM10027633]|uniref:sialidase family protein n=1 Tax=unclassified Cohnella TaxID=2636738 RepID=UPI003643FD14